MSSKQEIVNKINNTTELNEKQKSLIITTLDKKIIEPEEFLDSFFPASAEQLLAGLDYFPRYVSQYLIIYILDHELAQKISSLRNKGRYYDVIQNFFNSCKKSPDNKIDHVFDSISTLWINSGKNPSIFQDTKKFEAVLQNIPGYRDHFIHSFYVFIIGYYIICRLSELLDERNIKNYLGSNEPELTWMLASTFHDVAYPIERIEVWLGSLLHSFIGINPRNYFNFDNVIPNIYYNFMKMICSWHKNTENFSSENELYAIDWSFYNTLNSKILEKDHGVLSGLILAHQLAIRDRFIDYGKAWDFFKNHLPACHSICSHTLDYTIDFARHPFAFLLVLCDEIQDWGRPTQKVDPDVIFLREMNVVASEIPEIQLVVSISDKKKKQLSSILSKRLETSGKIRVKISDVNRVNFLVI